MSVRYKGTGQLGVFNHMAPPALDNNVEILLGQLRRFGLSPPVAGTASIRGYDEPPLQECPGSATWPFFVCCGCCFTELLGKWKNLISRLTIRTPPLTFSLKSTSRLRESIAATKAASLVTFNRPERKRHARRGRLDEREDGTIGLATLLEKRKTALNDTDRS
jgi:hypothetical protein